MRTTSIEYAALCVVVPVAWGVAVYWISRLIEDRIGRRSLRNDAPNGDGGTGANSGEDDGFPLDFHI